MLSSSESGSQGFPPTAEPPSPGWLYALTIFLSAFLLFEVEPLVAREILPWFGGSAAVWTVCLLFFQIVLLAGYAYAHVIVAKLQPRPGALVHLAVLLASALILPVIPSARWKPNPGDDPLWHILGLLLTTAGAPYFALAATSPLLQSWYARERHSSLPYRFFALSNFGSMLSLLSYPFLVEPTLRLSMQAWSWSGGFLVFAVLCAVLSWRSARLPALEPAHAATSPPLPGERARWIALAACPSGLLLAVTNHITQNIAAVPLLWVLPLSLYLLSFILTFENSRWYNRPIFLRLFAVAIAAMAYALADQLHLQDLRVVLPLFTLGLFVAAMVCHGELARRKPAPAHLTSFYLTISLGGAVGGLFVGAIAPAIFPALLEFPILLVLTPCVVLWTLWPESRYLLWFASAAATLMLAGYLTYKVHDTLSDNRVLTRNFYGALRVSDDDDLGVRELTHGTINHGEQYLDPLKRRQPITYYAPKTGVGMAVQALQQRGPVRIGVVGLGTGTMASWVRPQDSITFFEINPKVLMIAFSQFTYLRDCPGKVGIALGDARLSMEHDPPHEFDLLVLDAFSGDSIPVHLLTTEAFRIYKDKLAPGGILAVHISNRFLNLAPEVERLASSEHWEAHLISNDRDRATRTFRADWVLVGDQIEQRFPFIADQENEIDEPPHLRAWSDDFSNLWEIVRFPK